MRYVAPLQDKLSLYTLNTSALNNKLKALSEVALESRSTTPVKSKPVKSPIPADDFEDVSYLNTSA
jgi:hypothetical protein